MTISPQSRTIVADAILAQGPGYRNLADNVRCGGEPNVFVRAALAGVEQALRTGYAPDETEH